MKKITTLLFMALLSFIIIFIFASCNKDSEIKLPTSAYEKIEFAFNGVERSLKNNSSSRNSFDELKQKALMQKSVSNDNLSIIYNAMSVEKETQNPQFEYDEPPMIQFQYLKALYEEVGTDFEFGVKYSYTITGSIYYDFSSKSHTESQQYLNQYTMITSILIDIDSSDLITAEVSFDVTYLNNGISRHQKRYSELLLDYDMLNTIPTYNLVVIDIDDLLEFEDADEKFTSIEYDYVDVTNNNINEWRKFGVCSKEELTNYTNDDFIYKFSVLRAFKDNKIYRIENVFKKDEDLKNAVFSGLGFASEFNTMNVFLNKSSKENDKILTVVNKFNSILGKDIVNGFVYTGATEKWENESSDEPENMYIVIRPNQDIEEELYVTNDVTLSQLFTSNIQFNGYEKNDFLTIRVKGNNNNDVKAYYDLDTNELSIRVRSTSYSDTKWLSLNENSEYKYNTFSEIVKESGFIANSYGATEMRLEFDISLKSDSNVKLENSFYIKLINEEAYNDAIASWDLVNNYLNTYAIVKNAIPSIDGKNITYYPYIASLGNSGYITISSNDLTNIVADYKNKLIQANFVENTTSYTFTKRVSDDYILVLTVPLVSEKEVSDEHLVLFEFKESKKKDETITDAINKLIDNENVNIPDFEDEFNIECEYSVSGNEIRIELNDYSLINEYVLLFANIDYGFIIYKYLNTTTACIYKDGTIYNIRNMGKSIKVEKIEASLSIVGDSNSWNESDTNYDMTSLYTENNQLYLTKKVFLYENQSFKIAKDHSLLNGGYGYNLFAGTDSCVSNPDLYGAGDNNTIIVKATSYYTINVRFDISYGSDSNYQIEVLEIDVIENKKE